MQHLHASVYGSYGVMSHSSVAFCQGAIVMVWRHKTSWLDVSERATYKLDVMMHYCLYGQAPRNIADQLIPASGVASRLRLRSAAPTDTGATENAGPENARPENEGPSRKA